MNRRNFLRNLFAAAVAPVAVVKALQVEPHKCITPYTIKTYKMQSIPSLSFSNDYDTGFYRPSANKIVFCYYKKTYGFNESVV